MTSGSGASEDLETLRRPAAGGFEVLVAFALVVLVNLPQLAKHVVPINDTFYNFANFHVFYSELLFHGGRAAWLPYEGFGIQSDYEQLIALAPASYLVGLAGWLLHATDALVLFKIGVLLEQMAFVFGIWVLSRQLFAARATTWVLCAAAIGTTVWYAQQWWDLRIYYLFPLVLSFVLRFVATRRPEQLWLAGLTGVAWSIGNLPYLIPIWLLVLLVIAAVCVRDARLVPALLTPSRRNLVAFALFALAAATYLWFLTHALDHTLLRASDRDPLTGKVDEETFRSYGGKGNMVIVLNALLFGWPIHLPWGSWADNSAYLGLLPLVGLGIALARERSRIFLAFVTTAVLLVWLSFGGVGTRLAYYLPGFAYFRHVGLVYGLVKVLLLLASGFGLERLWRVAAPALRNPVLLLVAAVFALEALAALPALSHASAHGWVVAWGSHFFVRLLFYGVAVALCRWLAWPALGAALALALLADVASYQLAVFDRIPKLAERGPAAATLAREPVYREQRVALPDDPALALARIEDPASRQAFALATRREIKESYAYVYQFANVDSCHDHYRNDAHLVGVDALLALERLGLSIEGVAGCGNPKLRLSNAARVVPGREEMKSALVAALRAGEARPVVVQADGPAPGAGAAPPGASADRVRVTGFSLGALDAEVEVASPEGAWLVYADAFHPDWRARVNGVETPLVPANLAFKALRVPAGRSEVRLWLDRGAFGYAIAAIGLACSLGWLGWVAATVLRR